MCVSADGSWSRGYGVVCNCVLCERYIYGPGVPLCAVIRTLQST